MRTSFVTSLIVMGVIFAASHALHSNLLPEPKLPEFPAGAKVQETSPGEYFVSLPNGQGGTFRVPVVAQPWGSNVPLLPWGALFGAILIAYAVSGVNVVSEWDRRPMMRVGRYLGTAGPGLSWFDPLTTSQEDDVFVGDDTDEFTVESVQTHDNVPVSVSVVITYCADAARIKEYTVAVMYPEGAMRKRAVVAVTNAIGNTELDQILHDRRGLHVVIERDLRAAVAAWGLTIKAVETRDVQIADEAIQQAIAMKARATKEADAELARAAMQQQIAEQLNLAAAALTPEAWRLKGLETIVELCRSGNNNTWIVPSELVSVLGGKNFPMIEAQRSR